MDLGLFSDPKLVFHRKWMKVDWTDWTEVAWWKFMLQETSGTPRISPAWCSPNWCVIVGGHWAWGLIKHHSWTHRVWHLRFDGFHGFPIIFWVGFWVHACLHFFMEVSVFSMGSKGWNPRFFNRQTESPRWPNNLHPQNHYEWVSKITMNGCYIYKVVNHPPMVGFLLALPH